MTVAGNSSYVFAVADFGYSDPLDTPSNNFLAVEIMTIPAAGSLQDNGSAVAARQFISVSDINSGKLVFIPAPNGVGTAYASFTFQVEDDGGTLNGGANLDPYAKTMTINVGQIAARIVVSPVGGLSANGAEQFAATAYDASGDVLPIQPTFAWSITGAPLADNGTIDGNGLFTPPYASGSATVVATSGSVSGTYTASFPGAARWSSTGSSSWTDASTWTSTSLGSIVAAPGIRGITGDSVVFDTAAGQTVSLNGASPSLAAITFNGANQYAIASGTGGTLRLASGSGQVSIAANGGNPTISAAVSLDANLAASAASGSTLAIAGNLSGAGSLSFSGPGVLVLSGNNSYAVSTIVTGGTLRASAPSALPDGTNLSIGAGAAAFGAAPVTATAPAAAISSGGLPRYSRRTASIGLARALAAFGPVEAIRAGKRALGTPKSVDAVLARHWA